jgi:hypothetical protein
VGGVDANVNKGGLILAIGASAELNRMADEVLLVMNELTGLNAAGVASAGDDGQGIDDDRPAA